MFSGALDLITIAHATINVRNRVLYYLTVLGLDYPIVISPDAGPTLGMRLGQTLWPRAR